MTEPQEFEMSKRKGEAITDTEEWDNEVIDLDPITGIWYIAGKPVGLCQGVETYGVKGEKDEQV